MIHAAPPALRPPAPGAATLSLAPEGFISGYASLFDVPDLSGDVVVAGAFSQSLAQRPPSQVRLLFQHDPKEPVGVWDTIREDRLGLLVEGRLTLASSKVRDLAALVAAGAIDGLSIGFKTVSGTRDGRTGLRRLTRVDLWEISIVTFPMLPGAKITRFFGSTYPRRRGLGDTASRPADASTGPVVRLAAAFRSASQPGTALKLQRGYRAR